MFFLSTKQKRSLINKLNNNGPKIDLYGKPLTILYQSLHKKSIFPRCLHFDKLLCIKFKSVFSMAYASNFATRRSSGKQS